jgi:hypothetical protein
MAVAWWQPEFPLFEGHESVFNMGKVAPQLGELGTAWQQHEPKMLADVLAAAVRPCCCSGCSVPATPVHRAQVPCNTKFSDQPRVLRDPR